MVVGNMFYMISITWTAGQYIETLHKSYLHPKVSKNHDHTIMIVIAFIVTRNDQINMQMSREELNCKDRKEQLVCFDTKTLH
jgi:hypothetical protein